MSLWRAVRAGTRSLLRRQRVEQELDEELRHYLELATEHNVRAGMTRDAAERAARVQMGTIEASRERVRSGGWEAHVETSWQDLRFAVRGLRRNASFTLMAVTTLAVSGSGGKVPLFWE